MENITSMYCLHRTALRFTQFRNRIISISMFPSLDSIISIPIRLCFACFSVKPKRKQTKILNSLAQVIQVSLQQSRGPTQSHRLNTCFHNKTKCAERREQKTEWTQWRKKTYLHLIFLLWNSISHATISLPFFSLLLVRLAVSGVLCLALCVCLDSVLSFSNFFVMQSSEMCASSK